MHSCIPVILHRKITLPQAIIGYFPPENLKMRCIFSGTDKSVPYSGRGRFYEPNINLSIQRTDTGRIFIGVDHQKPECALSAGTAGKPDWLPPFGRLGSPRTIRKVLGRLLCLLSCRHKKVRPPAGSKQCVLLESVNKTHNCFILIAIGFFEPPVQRVVFGIEKGHQRTGVP